jgi:hypothetical protein
MELLDKMPLGYKTRLRTYKILFSVWPRLLQDSVELHLLIDEKEGKGAAAILPMFRDKEGDLASRYTYLPQPKIDQQIFGVHPSFKKPRTSYHDAYVA